MKDKKVKKIKIVGEFKSYLKIEVNLSKKVFVFEKDKVFCFDEIKRVF